MAVFSNATMLFSCALTAMILPAASIAVAQLDLGQEEIIQANGLNISVLGYSVPSYVDWDEDGIADLIVGQGSGTYTGKVRVYLNYGTACEPEFLDYFYVQSLGSDLTLAGSGCMGVFPRVVHWNDDGMKDLLIGTAVGNIRLYLNTNTNSDPQFDGGTLLQVGASGSKVNIDIGSRATCSMVDFDSDGRQDLISGGLDGKIHVFINEGEHFAPDFLVQTYVQDGRAVLVVPSLRSSPVMMDLDNDMKKDLLTGNTNGEILFYSNVGTDEAPLLNNYQQVAADGVPIDLAGTPRSRPDIADWTGDGEPDLLIGAADGQVHLYRGYKSADLNGDDEVNVTDLLMLLGNWGCTGLGDINNDSVVNVTDLLLLLGAWGVC